MPKSANRPSADVRVQLLEEIYVRPTQAGLTCLHGILGKAFVANDGTKIGSNQFANASRYGPREAQV